MLHSLQFSLFSDLITLSILKNSYFSFEIVDPSCLGFRFDFFGFRFGQFLPGNLEALPKKTLVVVKRQQLFARVKLNNAFGGKTSR